MRDEETAQVLKAFAVQAWGPESKSQHPYKMSGMPCMCLQPQHCGLGQRQENGWDLLVTAYSGFSKRNSLKRIRWRAIEHDTHSPPLPLCMHSCTHSHSYMHCTHTKNRYQCYIHCSRGWQTAPQIFPLLRNCLIKSFLCTFLTPFQLMPPFLALAPPPPLTLPLLLQRVNVWLLPTLSTALCPHAPLQKFSAHVSFPMTCIAFYFYLGG